MGTAVRTRVARGLALCCAVAGMGLAGLAVPTPATAVQASLSAGASPMWQTNGTVFSVAHASGVVYAAGNFTSVRPPGAAPGQGEQPRNHFAAFDAATGALLPLSLQSDNRLTLVEASRDGRRLYLAGTFTHVDGVPRSGIAALDTTTGALDRAWAPQPGGQVTAMAAVAGTVYLGGSFGTVNGQARTGLAAVDAASGALRAWAPTADGPVHALATTPDGSTVYAGGDFDRLDGNATYRAVGALDGTTGALEAFPAAAAMPPKAPDCVAKVKDAVVAGDSVYFAVEGTGGGCFDGTFAARVSDGGLKWKNTCRGATQAVEVVRGWLYKGSHAHDCAIQNAAGDPDAFPEVRRMKESPRYLLAQRLDNGFLGPWYPNTGGPPLDPTTLGPRTMASDGTQLFVGGDFIDVNGQGQQGLARFAPGDNVAPPRPTPPVAVSNAPGQVTVYVRPPVDPDDPDLLVDVYRDGAAAPFATLPSHSLFWRRTPVAVVDTGLSPGARPAYRAVARQATGTLASPPSPLSAPVTVIDRRAAYPREVAADRPALYWRLGDAGGATVAADSSGNRLAGIVEPGVAAKRAGSLGARGDEAFGFNGASGVVTTSEVVTAPAQFSVELRFRTTTTAGGKLVGFGDRRIGASSRFDRHLYLTSSGQLAFGVFAGRPVTLTTNRSYNDGAWHHVVGAQGPGGISLYVDGRLVATGPATSALSYPGYWRVGGDELSGWPSQPTSNYLAGSIDEVAVYPVALGADRVAAHWSAAERSRVASAAAPTAPRTPRGR